MSSFTNRLCSRLSLVFATPAFAALVLLAAAPARAETLEAVEKKLAEQAKKITTMSMKMKTTSDVSGQGFKSRSTMDGTCEYMIEGKKTYSRMDTVIKMRIEGAGIKQDMDSKSLSVDDGEFTWVISDDAGQKTVTKFKTDAQQVANWRDDMKDIYNIKLMPEETVDGKPCYVLEMTPKKPAAGGMHSRGLHYYQKDTCVLVKAVNFGPDRKPVSTTTFTDIKINPPLDKSRFKFFPLPGQPVRDMTKATGGMPKGDGE